MFGSKALMLVLSLLVCLAFLFPSNASAEEPKSTLEIIDSVKRHCQNTATEADLVIDCAPTRNSSDLVFTLLGDNAVKQTVEIPYGQDAGHAGCKQEAARLRLSVPSVVNQDQRFIACVFKKDQQRQITQRRGRPHERVLPVYTWIRIIVRVSLRSTRINTARAGYFSSQIECLQP